MRRFALFALIALSGPISSQALAQTTPPAQSGQAIDECERLLCEQLDNFAARLEAVRLISMVRDSRNFATTAIRAMYPIVNGNQASFAQIEAGLRRMNTGVHLFAVHKSHLQRTGQDRDLCVQALSGKPATDYYLFISGQGPEVARQHMAELGITSREENLILLQNVGVLTLCQGS